MKWIEAVYSADFYKSCFFTLTVDSKQFAEKYVHLNKYDCSNSTEVGYFSTIVPKVNSIGWNNSLCCAGSIYYACMCLKF